MAMDISQIAGMIRQDAPGLAVPQDGPKGSLLGQVVSKADAMSLVANAAEEAGFAKSEREETRLEARKLRPRGPDVDRVEQIQKYLEIMDKQGKRQHLDAFIAALRNASNLDPRTALATAKQFFSDPGDMATALFSAGKELGMEEVFSEAQAQLEDEYGMQVQTRLAAGIRAAEFGGLGSPEALKDLYAGAVLDATSPVDIFERIVADFGDTHVDEAMDFLTKTLGDTMSATTSQTDKALLESVAGDLEAVRLLRGLHGSCKGLLDRLHTAQGIRPQLSSTELLKEMLALRDTPFVGAFDMENLASRLGVDDLEQRILFFQDLQQTARALPVNLFRDEGGRLGIIDAVQMALDDAIAAEAKLYED
ncbi:type III secretion system gatekeeper subunit SctW [Desulfocurvus vexinensis]|uniref:type III secretion system gatekeeper subunit SctW n=1 Tax=Desulfocurvus vexinensis TaxID=399548 RepID=UPI00048FBA1D|nr:type III secretion system gatekeeper subunit SctW [Desulfocurvus vexinensis]